MWAYQLMQKQVRWLVVLVWGHQWVALGTALENWSAVVQAFQLAARQV
jgi:hypothetical protein